jgi:hypothetical protein
MLGKWSFWYTLPYWHPTIETKNAIDIFRRPSISMYIHENEKNLKHNKLTFYEMKLICVYITYKQDKHHVS